MDMSHLGRADMRVAERAATSVDYRVLVATVQAWQISTATARAQTLCESPQGEGGRHEPAALTRILLGGTDWQQAVLAQGGSFNPLFAHCAGER